MRKAKELWKCCECGETHDLEDDAMDCCRPRVVEVYGCPDCGSIYDDEEDALECCHDEENTEQAFGHADPLQLEAAGQQRLFA